MSRLLLVLLLLPIAINTFRIKRSRPVLLIDDPEKNRRNSVSLNLTSSLRLGLISSVLGSKFTSAEGDANLFQGHAERQSSHP